MQVRAVGIKIFLIFDYSRGFQPAACGHLESDWVIWSRLRVYMLTGYCHFDLY